MTGLSDILDLSKSYYPIIIAMAKDGGPRWIVVSDEHPGSLESRKIPFVCDHEKVECIRFQEMMLREGCQFR